MDPLGISQKGNGAIDQLPRAAAVEGKMTSVGGKGIGIGKPPEMDPSSVGLAGGEITIYAAKSKPKPREDKVVGLIQRPHRAAAVDYLMPALYSVATKLR